LRNNLYIIIIYNNLYNSTFKKLIIVSFNKGKFHL